MTCELSVNSMSEKGSATMIQCVAVGGELLNVWNMISFHCLCTGLPQGQTLCMENIAAWLSKQAGHFQPSSLEQTVSIWLYMILYMNQILIGSNKHPSGWLEADARSGKALSILMVKLVSARFSTFPSPSPYMHICMNKTKALHTQVCMCI